MYPFLSFIFTGTIIIVCLVSNFIFKPTRLFTALLALESLVMVPLWIYLSIFLILDKHTSSFGLVIFALIANMALNIFWYFYYTKKIRDVDRGYRIYMENYPKTQKTILIMSLLVTFQFFRMQYTRIFNGPMLNCTL